MTDIILYALLAITLAIVGWLIFLTKKYQDILQKAGILFDGEKEGNLSQVLKKYLLDVKSVEDYCYKIDNEMKKTRQMTEAGLHKSGFVRYNPFGNVGGNQSFSLCLLSEHNDGFVISSIHSREGTRVYAKTISKGKPDYNLSDEEAKSLELALKNK